jgi:hypothetical protein
MSASASASSFIQELVSYGNLHRQQIKVVSEIIERFWPLCNVMTSILHNYIEEEERCRSALLVAEMQSGKTGAIFLILAESIRLGKVNKVIYICGNSEIALQKKIRKEFGDFMKYDYPEYLEKEIGLPTGDESIELRRTIDNNIQILFGTELSKKKYHILVKNTLVVHDESHHAQNKGMLPHKLLTSMGIMANGELNRLEEHDNYYVSVSATPYAELVNMSRDNIHNKGLFRLHPGSGYKGVGYYYENNQIAPITSLEKLLDGRGRNLSSILSENIPGYALIRTKNSRDIDRVKQYCRDHNFDYKMYDSDKSVDEKHKMEELDELKTEPLRPTVIIINGRLRMGTTLCKDFILVVVETAKTSKSDTLFQSLLGRMCGYHDDLNSIQIFIPDTIFYSGEIERFIKFAYGNDSSIPTKAMNVKIVGQKHKKKSALNPIIPLRFSGILLDESLKGPKRHTLLVAMLREKVAAGNFDSHNPPKQTTELMEKIASCQDFKGIYIVKKDDGSNEITNKSYAHAARKIHYAISHKTPHGPGQTLNVKADGSQISLIHFSSDFPEYNIAAGDVYVIAKTRAIGIEEKIELTTTGKEIFR